MIYNLVKCPNTKSYMLNNDFKTPHQMVPQQYLTSRKMILGAEKRDLVELFKKKRIASPPKET